MQDFHVPGGTPSYYETKDITALADGASVTVDFSPGKGGRVAIDRLLVESTGDLSKQYAKIQIVGGADLPRICFEGVQLSTIKSYFFRGPMQGAWVLENNAMLRVTVTNASGGPVDTQVGAEGYGQDAIDTYMGWQRSIYGHVPQLIMLYAPATAFAANANGLSLDVVHATDVTLTRLMVGATDLSKVRLTLEAYRTTIIRANFAEMVNSRFQHNRFHVPVQITQNDKVRASIINTDGLSGHTVSLLGECYIRGTEPYRR